MQAVILAGGKGTRLAPYTMVFPKPLMPIGDVPILEIVIRQLKKHGFTKIVLAVGHLAGLIEAYFEDGSKWGVEITYSREDEPLGTAGPLALLDDLDENFLVMNGDLLTNIDYSDLMCHHLESGALSTVSIYTKEVPISLGVLKLDDDGKIVDYIEKPTLKYKVSMGIYVFNNDVLNYIRRGKYLDFPDLIKTLIQKNKNVSGYMFEGYWMDIGRHEDYSKVLEEFEKMKDELLF
ncbi:nucleoside-diphosphate-sugar pyrophosphorylase [Methanosarcina sp. 1.H.T.1A.1]|uniref:sugar phosphate nucleotidyltransferase n=1 Tax=Methanosarcina sp. 1.H.T.1A.1 TaxID=1483602 RepID=UPI000621D1F3|nr:sugar phosphate nucleotidyltransferase [Methanosarcina sp. 1.H.T.1A.1]KKH95137.1 nucleoside-diphosphate-sugar pyrophosphorylase [Methanosarcina sp. 1.H.T.1A.1]